MTLSGFQISNPPVVGIKVLLIVFSLVKLRAIVSLETVDFKLHFVSN